MSLLVRASVPVDNRDQVRAHLQEATQRSYVVAYRILGDADQARDACQEAAARALSARDRYDRKQPFYPWFYRILKNHCIDRIKGQKRTVSSAEAPAGVDGSRSAERSLLHGERHAAVVRAIAELPEEVQEVIELRHFQDLSYEEMAEVLDCPVGTVMSRLYRARKRLRTILLHDPGFAGHATERGGAR